MITEQMIIDRRAAECIVRELSNMLSVESYYQFKLIFKEQDNGHQRLTIVPHASAMEIILNGPT